MKEERPIVLDGLFKLDGLYFSSWVPREENLLYNRLWPDDPRTIPQYSLRIYYFNDVVSSLKTMSFYLSNLFGMPPTALFFPCRFYETDDIKKIMDIYCTKETNINSLELSNYPRNATTDDDEILTLILKQQNATSNLHLLFKPTLNFTFDFNTLRNTPKHLEIEYSAWVTWEQLLSLESETACLLKSNFPSSDFKTLIELWRDGWTPKWKSLMVEFKTSLDIDSYVSDEFKEIESGKERQKSIFLRNSSIQAYRFTTRIITARNVVDKTGYHLTRSDQTIATVTMENEKIGWFHIQSNDPNAEMLIPVTKPELLFFN
ncbi:hypothetical protein GCK72_003911 [Caenorhabditis remanei]|uniref:Sdz-33 F-box domain-containing protein n=1 Tax=Caenorhabditis remanei TaxID=31234 RepID=A0A6A5H9U8_CAERE|nr:hypothetical protein GCK72_003911 [Caenorhabditis remanei]KAF1763965.1 hypothetical protein GCK72_003911 [Caenorhabditis remanei]